MGMSMHIKGFIEPDNKFKKMKAIYDNCNELLIDVPREVTEFFSDIEPGYGTEIEIPYKDWSYEDDNIHGLEVKLDEIPKNTKVIRFYVLF